jgi:RecJ-like exonuclease
MGGQWEEILATKKRRTCPICGAPVNTKLCSRCGGTSKAADLIMARDCKVCGGRGIIYECSENPLLHRFSRKKKAPSFDLPKFEFPKTCPHCGGTGVVKPSWMAGAARCHFCKGTGRVT